MSEPQREQIFTFTTRSFQMSCPTCDHETQSFDTGSDYGIFWCPRCGTVTFGHGPHDLGMGGVPSLVQQCQAFEGGLIRTPRDAHTMQEVFGGLQASWRSLGIAEAIHTPGNRPK
jgi:ribosomal protein S27E